MKLFFVQNHKQHQKKMFGKAEFIYVTISNLKNNFNSQPILFFFSVWLYLKLGNSSTLFYFKWKNFELTVYNVMFLYGLNLQIYMKVTSSHKKSLNCDSCIISLKTLTAKFVIIFSYMCYLLENVKQRCLLLQKK